MLFNIDATEANIHEGLEASRLKMTVLPTFRGTALPIRWTSALGNRILPLMQIREANPNDVATIAMLVSQSNQDVAHKFGLTADNCPRHPSFYTTGWVESDLARGERYFILEEDSDPIACVAYETPSVGLAYLNRLSVLPRHRRRGLGARLVEHIIELARAGAIQAISIGVIGEHTGLQRWYEKLGFIIGETKRFPHLPFSVTYMTYAVQGSQAP